MGAAYTPETWDEWTAKQKAAHNNGNGHGNSLNVEVQRMVELLPTPTSRDYKDNVVAINPNRPNDRDVLSRALVDLLPTPTAVEAAGGLVHPDKARAENKTIRLGAQVLASTGHMPDEQGEYKVDWGKYEPAVQRWEALTRPAPSPVEPAAKPGKWRLNAEFSEWMMGWPLNHVTGRGLPRAQELKIIGNGVVTQQAKYAITTLLKLGQANDTTGM